MKKFILFIMMFVLTLFISSCDKSLVSSIDEPIKCGDYTYSFVHVQENQKGDEVELSFRLDVSTKLELHTIKIEDIKIVDKKDSYDCLYMNEPTSWTYAGVGPAMATMIAFKAKLPTFTDDGDYYFQFKVDEQVFKFDLSE